MKVSSTRIRFSLPILATLAILISLSAYTSVAQTGLQFNGSSQYVTFGAATSQLGVTNFTLEAWVKKDATGGKTMSTGTNGLDGVSPRPLVYPVLTKGMGEGETPANINTNWFLGITSTGFIGADFEDHATGLNHPVWGNTLVPVGEWHHIAATYDGRTWRLYLDGILDKTLDLGAVYTPEFGSIQHAALATGLPSGGAPTSASGYFKGVIDEPRVWNIVRSDAEIHDNMGKEIESATGLVGRWGLNDGTGSTAANSVAGSPSGTLVASPIWVSGAPALGPNQAPIATNVVITGTPEVGQLLTGTYNYTDAENNTEGASTFRWLRNDVMIVGATSLTYTTSGLDDGANLKFEVTPIAGSGTTTGVPVQSAPLMISSKSLSFNGTNAYANLGDAPALRLPQFTIETWFRRDGTGVSVSTGTGGISAIPLVAKGTSEDELPGVDINYFLGISTPSNVICADFEEGAAGANHSLNHPIAGTTPIVNGVWYHAAATYDGSKWQLFLNGNLEGELVVGQPVASATSSPVAFGSSIRSNGTTAQGFFYGTMDELRIWSIARTAGEIQATINQQISSPTANLVGRWSLDGTVNGSAGTTVNGTLVGSGYAWTTSAAPFNITLNAPPYATEVTISGTPMTGQTLTGNYTYNDAEGNPELNSTFRWLRNGTAITGATAITYVVTDLDAGTSVVFEVTPKASSGTLVGVPVQSSPVSVQAKSLRFTGTNGYINLGNAAPLRLSTFTLETWFKRDGTGVSVTTGGGGIMALPLIAKGTSESETPTVDINYFLGITTPSNVLCADFEEGATGASPSGNHPISGVTPIVTGTWYHAAVTYDGSKWQLFLNGNLEKEMVVGQPVAMATNSPVSFGTSVQSNGTSAQGFFDGTMDEVRIWNTARTQAQIWASANAEITTPQANLVGRWSLDGNANSSAGTIINGTVTGSGYAWTGIPAAFNVAPNTPPTATGVSITGSPEVGQVLTGNYNYFDSDGNTEGTSTFRWLRNDVAISGATAQTYTLTLTDLGNPIKFEVTPVAVSGVLIGSPIESAPTNNIKPVNTAPVANDVAITGTPEVGQVLTGHFSYQDVDGDLPGLHTYRWLRNDVAIVGATSITHTLALADLNAAIKFEVTPVALSGVLVGTPAASIATAAIKPANTPPVANDVTISGTGEVGQVLTGHFTYHLWRRFVWRRFARRKRTRGCAAGPPGPENRWRD